MQIAVYRSWCWRTVLVLAALMVIREGLAGERAPKVQGRANQGSKTSSRSRPAARSNETDELFGISWFRSLESAGKAAGRGKPFDQGKPVFCFRVLGDLAGFM